jgi:hypothetical protein
MPLNLGSTSIEKVDIVDDKADVRRIVALSVEEAELVPMEEDEPLPPLEKFVHAAAAKADAAICDYKLNLGTYAEFNGAQAVARFYELKWPALLCTTWGKAEIDAMRAFRRRIPVLIHTDDLNPDSIATGFESCIREFNSDFLPSRRPWRTLVRVEEVERNMSPKMFFVVLPGWSSSDKIRLPLDLIPNDFRDRIEPGVRFHALVNKGVENQDELYFDEFEFS